MDFLKGKKTFIANILTVLLAIAGAIGDTGWIPAEQMLYGLAGLNILLRIVTTGPAWLLSLPTGNNP